MEKTKIFNGKKMEPISNKAKIGEKIDNLWGKPASAKKKIPDRKRLTVKLETTGTDKRKLLLKLESGTSNIHTGNYTLISELLKEFFNNGKE